MKYVLLLRFPSSEIFAATPDIQKRRKGKEEKGITGGNSKHVSASLATETKFFSPGAHCRLALLLWLSKNESSPDAWKSIPPSPHDDDDDAARPRPRHQLLHGAASDLQHPLR